MFRNLWLDGIASVQASYELVCREVEEHAELDGITSGQDTVYKEIIMI